MLTTNNNDILFDDFAIIASTKNAGRLVDLTTGQSDGADNIGTTKNKGETVFYGDCSN